MNEELIVSSLEDENDGDFSAGDLSLREAIAQAESGETITFNSDLSGGTISLSLGELIIDKSLTIQGLGAKNILIDGGGLDSFFDGIRIFNINDNSDTESRVVINDLTIAGGGAFVSKTDNSSGAGIFNTENLEINNSVIRDNTADLSGGGIYSQGTLTVNNSAIYNNKAQRRGVRGGGIFNSGTATINQSTIANNSVNARGSGGGISNSGILTVSNSTVSGNLGGIENNTNGEATIISTIVAGNINNNDLESEITSGGNNLIGGDSTSSLDFTGNLVNVQDSDIVGEPDVSTTGGFIDNSIDALLGELQDNGGLTPTIALLEGSPAIDAGSNPNNLEFDQRDSGFARTVGDGTDIGAFEVQQDDGNGETPSDLVVSILEDENDGDFSAGDLSLREAIALANEREGADTIAFDSSLNGGTIALTEAQPILTGEEEVFRDLVITDSLTINGLGAENLSISGNNASRVFFVDDGNSDNQIDVFINKLTVKDGNSNNNIFPYIDGGGFLNRENLTITNSAVLNNSGEAGGAILTEGDLQLKNSTISGNSSFGAPIGKYGGYALISNSTIANNSAGSTGGGGAIDNTLGDLRIINSTITNNSGYSAAVSNGRDNTVTIASTIIAGNSADSGLLEDDVSGTFVSEGNNLIGNSTGSNSFDSTDIVGTAENPIDPQLGELQDNGGSTQTIALLEGSPAIDAGSNPDNLQTDQRGEGFDRTVGGGTDIGAFEVQDDDGGETPTDLVVSILEDENDGDFSAGDLSLREAIALANEQQGIDTISFDSSLSGGTISINESNERELIISDSVAINGLGQDNLTLDGGFIFNVESGVDLAIDGLNLIGGKIESFGNLTFSNSAIAQTISLSGSSDNSSIISRGTLNLTDSAIEDSDGGGNLGVLIESGTATIERSTIANHEGVLGGAGIIVRADAVADVINSTIANNSSRGNAGISNSGIANVTNSTVVNNNGGPGSGGVINLGEGVTTLTSNIIANNAGAGDGRPVQDVDGEFISGGNNLIGNGDDGTGFVESDLIGNLDNPIDPLLDELQDNGGSTQTISLLDGSPAIDVGSNPNNLEFDQRGDGFDRTVGGGTDIGAYEVQDTDNNGETPDPQNPSNVLEGTKGKDQIDGTDNDELILGFAGRDLLNGNGGNDTLIGGTGKDTLNGGAGDDLLEGNNGKDVLIGGAGNDTLIGGRGHDIFVLESFDVHDVIVDFASNSDRFQLADSLSFGQIGIVDDEDGRGALILDLANNDSVIALVENVRATDLDSHVFF